MELVSGLQIKALSRRAKFNLFGEELLDGYWFWSNVKCLTFMVRQRSLGSIAFFFNTFYDYSNINIYEYVTHGHISLGENVLN